MFVLVMDAELGETDAAAAAQRTPIPVEVNVPAVPELSLAELTQVWTLGVGSDNPAALTISFSSSRIG